MKILVLVPAYNEEAALAATVESLLTREGYDILIVNDGSIDRTAQIAAELAAAHKSRVQHISMSSNVGIGGAVQSGFIYASRHDYDVAVQYDGDGQHSIDSLPDLISHAIEHKLDLCVGSRFLIEDNTFRSTYLRRIGIRFFAWLIGLLTGVQVTDPTSGYRVYSRAALTYFSRYYPDDYPEPEALVCCARNGLKVGEFPVRMHARQGGRSSIRYFHSLYYMVKVTAAILIDRIRRKEVV